MQAEYPKKIPPTHWDGVHLQPRVRKFPETGESSEVIARKWRPPPEVIQQLKPPVPEVTYYDRDYTVTSRLTRSQTREDFTYKAPETHRFIKHTAWAENEYIYPPSRRPMIEPSWHKDLEPLDTTHEGFEKYLDPYLTTSRLHHRPYTAEQSSRNSVTRDILTYHTFSKEPWVRTPKPRQDEWRLPLGRHKYKYDRESIKKDASFSLPKENELREMTTHNKPKWVPGTFRSEAREKYVPPSSQPGSRIQDPEMLVRSYYRRQMAKLNTNIHYEHSTTRDAFSSEYSHVGTGRPLCSVLDQFKEKNKRLELKSTRIG